ncbi:MAG: type II secretion system protein GspN, partial [Chloroflexi bacterium]|nr:type II secretion system protein GspN [Chloroflexota bacterium]
ATRPADGKPTTVRIDKARVRVSPFAAIFGRQSVSLSAEALGGDIDLGWDGSKTGGQVQLEVRDVAMASLPGVKEAINVPLAGSLNLDVDLRVPGQKVAEASGVLGWLCKTCAFGDGKAKLKMSSDPTSEGITVPRIRFGDFSGRIAFDKGQGKLQAVQARSPDGEVTIEGEIRLADPLPFSYVDLYVVFKLSDALLKADDRLKLLLQLGESMGGKRPDGSYGLRLTGSLSRMGQPRWQRSSPFAGSTPPAAPRPAAPTRPAANRPPPPAAPVVEQPPPPTPSDPHATSVEEPTPPPVPSDPSAYPSPENTPTPGLDAGAAFPE